MYSQRINGGRMSITCALLCLFSRLQQGIRAQKESVSVLLREHYRGEKLIILQGTLHRKRKRWGSYKLTIHIVILLAVTGKWSTISCVAFHVFCHAIRFYTFRRGCSRWNVDHIDAPSRPFHSLDFYAESSKKTRRTHAEYAQLA